MLDHSAHLVLRLRNHRHDRHLLLVGERQLSLRSTTKEKALANWTHLPFDSYESYSPCS